MKIQTTILLSTIFLSFSVFAENHMLIIGGGGEPAGAQTQFDEVMSNFGRENLKGSSWKYEVSFNGGHSSTENMLRESYPNPAAPTSAFTKENYSKMIDSYKAKILMGEIKKGDQMMIIINSHGARKIKDEKTHFIATSGKISGPLDFNDLSGAPLASIDDIGELAKIADKNGIKLGIVDLSCHAGETLNLKKMAPSACIVAASGPQHFSFSGTNAFTGKFLKNLKPGVNLEKAFLNARANTGSEASFPMISTEENDAIVAEVYKSITPYLYFTEPGADKLSDFFAANSSDRVMCIREGQFKELLSKIDQLSNAATGNSAALRIKDMKQLLLDYKNIQDSALLKMKSVGGNLIDQKEIFTSSSTIKTKDGPIKLELSLEQILDSNPEKSAKEYEEYAYYAGQRRAPNDQAKHLANADIYKKVAAKKASIMANFPNIKQYKEQAKLLTQEIQKSRAIAEKIGLYEKQLYDELYKQKQSLNFNEPCRSFTF